MMRIAAALSALVLFAVPSFTAAIPAVVAVGAAGLLLAAIGIIGRWPRVVTVAACVFLIAYTVALWISAAPLNVVTATLFGLALLLLLHAVELARCARGSVVDVSVVRSQLLAWAGLGAATLGLAMLGMTLARGTAAAVPLTAAPVVATAAALGVVLALALALMGARRRG